MVSSFDCCLEKMRLFASVPKPKILDNPGLRAQITRYVKTDLILELGSSRAF